MLPCFSQAPWLLPWTISPKLEVTINLHVMIDNTDSCNPDALASHCFVYASTCPSPSNLLAPQKLGSGVPYLNTFLVPVSFRNHYEIKVYIFLSLVTSKSRKISSRPGPWSQNIYRRAHPGTGVQSCSRTQRSSRLFFFGIFWNDLELFRII